MKKNDERLGRLLGKDCLLFFPRWGIPHKSADFTLSIWGTGDLSLIHFAPSLLFSKSDGFLDVGAPQLSFFAGCLKYFLCGVGWLFSITSSLGVRRSLCLHIVHTVEKSDCYLDVFLCKCKCLCYLGFSQPYWPMFHCLFCIFFIVSFWRYFVCENLSLVVPKLSVKYSTFPR